MADIRWAKKNAIKGKGKDNMQGSVVEMIGSGRTKPVEQFLKFNALSGYVSHLCIDVAAAYDSTPLQRSQFLPP